MTDADATIYPTYEDHERAWHELARNIARQKGDVREVDEGTVPANSKAGELTIIGTGIETVGISVGDQKILEAADKVLYCVADPATIVWLKRLRPDALDLYVLYGDWKIRYTTYMQMAEAQLYWVRQGLKVVVVFYGHPGIFVLSSHRAIKLARREGHRAVMKAGVCALDTLCADLGVDPSHPGLQTHEATDCLTRRRRIDTSLHVILWQVGLIGELGYRRHGYLNRNFSYFVSWLQELYGSDYQVTHYIGSRYPTIEPLIEPRALGEFHDPRIQASVTGLSTFYIPPRDVVPTDDQTAKDLGLVREGQRTVTPPSPLREIGRYGRREMAAFAAFERFGIPPSYQWQDDTAASDFLIALRFDTELQELYRRDPLKALDDPRFSALSDKERALLASRDPGAIQIAAKGAFRRSPANERLVTRLLNSKAACNEMLRRIRSKPRAEAQVRLRTWLAEGDADVDLAMLHRSIDFVYRNNLYPWTGVYAAREHRKVITLVGNRNRHRHSVVYVGDHRIRRYRFESGTLSWQPHGDVPCSGVLRFDHERGAARRIVGKTWGAGQTPGEAVAFVATEVDPGRHVVARGWPSATSEAPLDVHGEYAVRSTGRFANDVMRFSLSSDSLAIDEQRVAVFTLDGDTLSWTGGVKNCHSGRVSFLVDPIIGSVELYGESHSNEEAGTFKCYGARMTVGELRYGGPPIGEWAESCLARIAKANQDKGGLLLWHKWEKFHFTNLAVSRYLSTLV